MVVYVSASSFSRIKAEVERWRPSEAMFFPLAALKSDNCPLEAITLDRAESAVVARVLLPPEQYKKNTGGSTMLQGVDGDVMTREFMSCSVQPVVSRFPRLDLFMSGHSHPFADAPWLSRGGRHSDEATLQRTVQGLAGKQCLQFWIALLAYGRCCGNWKLAAFAATSAGITQLEEPVVVSNRHELVRQAHRIPYYWTKKGTAWRRWNCRQLKLAGFNVVRGFLPRGWDAFNIIAGSRVFAVCMPPDFPAAPAKAYAVAYGCTVPVELPRRLASRSFEGVCLVRLARHLHKENA